jgi:hypothetical protein
MTDFRRCKWRPHRHTNSVAKLGVAPRVSLIVALDTRGRIYWALLQANSNSKVMRIFFHHLAKMLEAECADYKDRYILQIDNAPYHSSSATMRLFRSLGLPVIFTGPHSYDAAPCEVSSSSSSVRTPSDLNQFCLIQLVFSHFKKGDINPLKLKTGKRVSTTTLHNNPRRISYRSPSWCPIGSARYP